MPRNRINRRYSNGNRPLYDTTTATMKTLLFLTDDEYVEAYKHFEQICVRLGVRGKAASTAGEWQAAIDSLIRDNAHINWAIHGVPGTPKQIADRRTVLDTMCRKTITKFVWSDRNRANAGSHPASSHHHRLQPAPTTQHVLGPSPALLPPILVPPPGLAQPAALLPTPNNANQFGEGNRSGLTTTSSASPYANGYQQNQQANQNVLLSQPLLQQTLLSIPAPSSGHTAGGMKHHDEIPIDPVLLAIDARTRAEGPYAVEHVEADGGVELGRVEMMNVETDGETWVDMMEEM